MTTATERATVPVRVYPASHAELKELQGEFYKEHRVWPTLADVVARLLADRKPVQP